MARKNLDVQNISLEQRLQAAVECYATDKEAYDKLDKTVKQYNATIKDLMKQMELTTFAHKDWKVTYSVAERKTMDEDKLLDVINKHKELAFEVVKTKQYVDMDALEAAIYNGKVNNDILVEMKSCESCKEVVTLRLSKNKGGNDE